MITVDNINTDLQLFHQRILGIYQSDSLPTEKWTAIASYMHDNNATVVKAYTSIRKKDERTAINLDYKIDFAQLQNQISKESDELRKSSFIILSLHNMIYDLLSTEGNYYFTLNGQEEMAILKKPLVYYVNLSSKPEQNVYFHAYILLYALESLFNKHFYIGIDFEYTNKKIQMGQFNFEHNVALQSIIMLVSPNDLEPVMMENLINIIICNKSIKKILHGSDSLDIPYVYDHMLAQDSEKIISFTKTLIDTRFLCEYYKLTRDQPSDYKCSIYDEDPSRSAVYYFGVISESQQNRLAELLQSMPAHHDIQWNIRKLPKSQVLYAQYDVIFLKYFYYRIIHMGTEDEASDSGKKDIIELYKHVLNEITRFVYLENNNVTYLRAKCKEEVNMVNNYFIRKPNAIIKLIDIYNQVSVGLETTHPRVIIDKLAKVNHFKVTIMTLIKRIVYGFISQKCRVYKDKSTLWADKLDNQFILDFLKEMEFNYLYAMYKELFKVLEIRVAAICGNL